MPEKSINLPLKIQPDSFARGIMQAVGYDYVNFGHFYADYLSGKVKLHVQWSFSNALFATAILGKGMQKFFQSLVLIEVLGYIVSLPLFFVTDWKLAFAVILSSYFMTQLTRWEFNRRIKKACLTGEEVLIKLVADEIVSLEVLQKPS